MTVCCRATELDISAIRAIQFRIIDTSSRWRFLLIFDYFLLVRTEPPSWSIFDRFSLSKIKTPITFLEKPSSTPKAKLFFFWRTQPPNQILFYRKPIFLESRINSFFSENITKWLKLNKKYRIEPSEPCFLRAEPLNPKTFVIFPWAEPLNPNPFQRFGSPIFVTNIFSSMIFLLVLCTDFVFINAENLPQNSNLRLLFLEYRGCKVWQKKLIGRLWYGLIVKLVWLTIPAWQC